MPLYYLIVDCSLLIRRFLCCFLLFCFCSNYSLKNVEEKFFNNKNDTIKESANNNNKTQQKNL